MKVVINSDYGGYGLSNAALELYMTKKGISYVKTSDGFRGLHGRYLVNGELFTDWDIKRHDSLLVEIVEELGKKSWGSSAKLKVVDLPENCEYSIDEYDGWESVETWFEITEEELINGMSPEKVAILRSAQSIKVKVLNHEEN